MIDRETLPGGLTLLFEDVPAVRSVTIGVWLRMGSRHEPARLGGISHFLEHLVFKGTETRNAKDIALLADRMGGNLDAFTSKEMTCFYVRCLDEHLMLAVDLLADIVRNPRFDAVELERERGVILEEIRMVTDAPEDRIYDLFAERVWPKHPLGRPIQGTIESVSKMSRDTILRYFRDAYVPENMLVAVAGRITADDRQRVREAFSSLRSGEAVKPVSAPKFRFDVVTESRKQMEQVHLLFGVPGLPSGHEDRFAMHVLNTVLGGSLSSRLFHKIREERGLVYAVSSSTHGHQGVGLLTVYAGTSPSKAREVVALALAEMRDLAEHGPTREEWEVARDHLKGSYLLGLESTSARMSRIAREEMVLGRQMTADEIAEELDAATPERVRDLAARLFTKRKVSLAAVGRIAKLGIREKDLVL